MSKRKRQHNGEEGQSSTRARRTEPQQPGSDAIEEKEPRALDEVQDNESGEESLSLSLSSDFSFSPASSLGSLHLSPDSQPCHESETGSPDTEKEQDAGTNADSDMPPPPNPAPGSQDSNAAKSDP